MMDIEELRSVQTRERATEGLQELRESFYEDVARYLESLREQRREAAAAAEDPFRSQQVTDLSDEIETAEQVAEAIYERRIGKLVKQASLSAAGMPADQDGLTAEEQELYEALVDRIEQNKARVLDTLSGDISADPSETSDGTPGGHEDAGTERSGYQEGATTGTSPAAVMDGERDPVSDEPADPDTGATPDEPSGSSDSSDEDSIERTRVRVTEDVGEIFGVDERAYTLERDDVVDLPAENADPLIDRDAAERLE